MRIFEIEPGKYRNISLSKFDDQQHFNKIWDRLIAPNCSQIIDIYKQSESALYRGAKNKTADIYRGVSWQERKPVDSDRYLSTLFDQMLAANGMTALRSNSIFATSSYSHAKGFGSVYILFPVNGFEYTYTNRRDIVVDQIVDFIPHDIFVKINDWWKQALIDKFGDEKAKIIFPYHTWLSYEQENYTDSEMAKLHKALLRLKALDPTNPNIQSLSVESLITPENFAKLYQPKNTDLTYALGTKVEVYIRGQYYAIDIQHKEWVTEKLRIGIYKDIWS